MIRQRNLSSPPRRLCFLLLACAPLSTALIVLPKMIQPTVRLSSRSPSLSTSMARNSRSSTYAASIGSNVTASSLMLPANELDTTSFLFEQDLSQQYSELMDYQAQEESSMDSSTVIQQQKSNAREVLVARLLLLGAAALYGTNFATVKLLGETDMPVGLSSTLRFGMAALATSPWLLPNNNQPTATTNNIDNDDDTAHYDHSSQLAATLAGFEVGMWNSIGYVAQAVGLETTPASTSAFLCSLAVVVVPLLDWMVGKRLLPREMVGATLAVVGVGMLELGGGSAGGAQNVLPWSLTSGAIASLIQPLAFGMGFWRMEKAMHQYPKEANRSTAAQLLAIFCGSAIYTAVADPASLQNGSQLQAWLTDPAILVTLFWTGVVTTALTIYMETVALTTLTAAATTLIFLTEPLWGSAFAALLLGERFGAASIFGSALILLGCLYSNGGIEGILQFFQQHADDTTNEANDQTDHGVSCSNHHHLTLLRTGLASMINSSLSSVLEDISIGTRILGNQLQDVLEDLLCFVDVK